MFFIETATHAPDYLKALIASHDLPKGGLGEFKAVVMARRFDSSDPVKYPVLRDRTEEFKLMLVGFGDERSETQHVQFKGHELAEKFGYKPVGAQYAATYDILWIN